MSKEADMSFWTIPESNYGLRWKYVKFKGIFRISREKILSSKSKHFSCLYVLLFFHLPKIPFNAFYVIFYVRLGQKGWSKNYTYRLNKVLSTGEEKQVTKQVQVQTQVEHKVNVNFRCHFLEIYP